MTAATVPKAFERPGRKYGAGTFFDDETCFRILCFVFAGFCFRDALTGAFRYGLQQVGLDAVWFIPDIMAVFALWYFVVRIVGRNQSAFGWILIINCVSATIIGALFMDSSAFTIFSSIKLFLPIFCGFALCGRSLTEVPWVRRYLLFISLLSAAGLLAGPLIDFPWVGAQVEAFGQVKEVGRLRWAQGDMRYGGFAGDNTMAAYMMIFPYFMIHQNLSKFFNVVLWIVFSIALYLSNSKTAMLVSLLFIVYYLIEISSNKDNFLEKIRLFAKYSFFLVPTPIILIIILGGIDLSKISPLLFSMQDRINTTWVFPFTALADISPPFIITGCGLGCFTYPMETTYLSYLMVPVDNFYLATYLMFGFPFIITIFGMFTASYKSKHMDKIVLMTLLNLYCVTVQCYGPSTATILIGYAFSDMFLKSPKGWKRKGARPELQ